MIYIIGSVRGESDVAREGTIFIWRQSDEQHRGCIHGYISVNKAIG